MSRQKRKDKQIRTPAVAHVAVISNMETDVLQNIVGRSVSNYFANGPVMLYEIPSLIATGRIICRLLKDIPVFIVIVAHKKDDHLVCNLLNAFAITQHLDKVPYAVMFADAGHSIADTTFSGISTSEAPGRIVLRFD